MNSILVTEPMPGDGKSISEIHKNVWLASYTNTELGITQTDILSKDFDSQKKIDGWERTIKEKGSNKFYLLIAKDETNIVGFCSGVKEDDTRELAAIYILPEYQGKGIGARLAQGIISWLGRDNDIITRVIEYNVSAIEFYKKMGFSIVGDIHDFYELPNGKKLPEIEMVLKKK